MFLKKCGCTKTVQVFSLINLFGAFEKSTELVDMNPQILN